MEANNRSVVKAFIILGFSSMPHLQALFFILILATYVLTVTANLVIISVVKANQHLHRPTAPKICSSLTFLEILCTTSTAPKMLESLSEVRSTISVAGCITQLYLFFALGSIQCFLLVIMAYDRYLAICHPLRYPAIMTMWICTRLIRVVLLGGFLAPLLPIIFISRLSFCGPEEIQHYFCDAGPLLRRSCGDASLSSTLVSVLASSVILSTCLLTVVSYGHIIVTILRIPSTTGRQKAFSTCASHLAVVVVYYGTDIFIYVRPIPRSSSELDKVVSFFYVVITPLLNPMIYSLRNKEVKDALKKGLTKNTVFPKSWRAFRMVCG
ncbi:olfactory receptor 11L1-like [Mauremys reevesii]|uniref:olfactory receptor 11L1-like n=1 Tax=Mauremys reevesii TaxID=260615 RepID=UPI00193FE725|nr:olfactory receptor 11L1-like [Mauremys reevesii]